MRAAGTALEVHVVAATGVGMSFAAGDDWLAARVTYPALVKNILLA